MNSRILFIICATIFLSISTVNASLIIINDNVLYDDVNNRYWDRILHTATYSDALQYATSLDANPLYAVSSSGDWRMATQADMDSLLTNFFLDIASDFYTTDRAPDYLEGRYDMATKTDYHAAIGVEIRYVYPDGYWTRSKEEVEYSDIVDYTIQCVYHFDSIPDDRLGAWFAGAGRIGNWIVADSLPVSEPSTLSLVLLSMGLTALARCKPRHK